MKAGLRPLHAALIENVQTPGKGAAGFSGAFCRRPDKAFFRAPDGNQAVFSQGIKLQDRRFRIH